MAATSSVAHIALPPNSQGLSEFVFTAEFRFANGNRIFGGLNYKPWTSPRQSFSLALAVSALPTCLISRRKVLITAIPAFTCYETAAYAEGGVARKEDNDDNLLGGILPLLDQNEKTKTGKALPKGYIKSTKEVVKALKESFKEDSADDIKFRKAADSAKEAIRNYLRDWSGNKLLLSEESYTALERALRVLADFYSKKGPKAALPADIKTQILGNLDVADAAL